MKFARRTPRNAVAIMALFAAVNAMAAVNPAVEQYAQAQWDRFFAQSIFYRSSNPVDSQDPGLILLEALALIKHCQIESAQALLQSLERRAPHKLTAFHRVKIQELTDLIHFQKQLSQKVTTASVKARPLAFSHSSRWRVSPNATPKLLEMAPKGETAPGNLRVYVKDRCDQKHFASASSGAKE